MSEPNGTPGVDASGLRERLPNKPDAPQKAESVETAQDAVRALNDKEAKEDKDEKDKRTFGRTPDGTGAYSTSTCWQGGSAVCMAQISSQPATLCARNAPCPPAHMRQS